MKSLWVTPNESRTDERGVVAGDEGDEEEEEVTKVITHISRIHLISLCLGRFPFRVAKIFQIPNISIFPLLCGDVSKG